MYRFRDELCRRTMGQNCSEEGPGGTSELGGTVWTNGSRDDRYRMRQRPFHSGQRSGSSRNGSSGFRCAPRRHSLCDSTSKSAGPVEYSLGRHRRPRTTPQPRGSRNCSRNPCLSSTTLLPADQIHLRLITPEIHATGASGSGARRSTRPADRSSSLLVVHEADRTRLL